ncbi:MAG: PTS sugar transporter subunit IIA [Opitutae bacterium]|nr:PTS sugar transporter subunit IIA [Opitutae bacterium]
MPHRTLTIDELADHLHVARRHVERLIKEGDLPCTMRGGRMLFVRDEIDDWVSQRLLRLPGRSLDWYHQQMMPASRRHFPRAALIPVLLQTEHIDLELAGKTRAAVIGDMVGLAERTGWVFDARELRDSVEEREALCSTALPGGLALLHARQQRPFRFERSFIVLGRTIQAIPFGAPDGRTSRLFFLLCCQDEDVHLHALARLCLLARKTKILEQLMDAPDAAAAHEALVAAELGLLPAAEPVAVVPGKRRRGKIPA